MELSTDSGSSSSSGNVGWWCFGVVLWKSTSVRSACSYVSFCICLSASGMACYTTYKEKERNKKKIRICLQFKQKEKETPWTAGSSVCTFLFVQKMRKLKERNCLPYILHVTSNFTQMPTHGQDTTNGQNQNTYFTTPPEKSQLFLVISLYFFKEWLDKIYVLNI